MRDILGKEIVCYEEAIYLKAAGFDNECTGYYHLYNDEGYCSDEDLYECAGWKGLYRNSFSISRAAAPTKRAAKIWYTKNHIKPFGDK